MKISPAAFMLGFLGGIIVLIPALYILLSSPQAKDFNHFTVHLIDRKLALAKNCADIISIGDSSGLFGLNPEIIEKETGQTFLNLNMQGSVGYAAQKTILKKVVNSGCKPSLYVLYMHPSNILVDLSTVSGKFSDLYFQTITNGWSGYWARISKYPLMIFKTLKSLSESPLEAQSWEMVFQMAKAGYIEEKRPPLPQDCKIRRKSKGQDIQGFQAFLKELKNIANAPILSIRAPSAACADQSQYEIIKDENPVDIHIDQLDSTLFVDEAHTTPQGASAVSKQVAKHIRKYRP